MKSWLTFVICGSCLLFCSVQGQTPSDNDVRLVHGPDQYSGTVEVYRSGGWGRVCPNGWNAASSSVVCRQLGFDKVVSFHTEGERLFVNWEESASFTVAALSCMGTESSLSECTLITASPSCSAADAAGIVCRNFSNGDFRLAGGTETEGTAEVYFGEQWVPVCANADRNERTISLLCTQLGSPSFFVLTSKSLQVGSSVLVGNLNCSSSHQTAAECFDGRASVQPTAQCTSRSALTLICTQQEGNVRLIGGPLPNMGQVEVYQVSRWNSFCASGWTNETASVVCKQLGFAGYSSWFSSSTGLEVVGLASTEGYYQGITCTGSEDVVFACNGNIMSPPTTCDSQGRTILICQGTDISVSVLSFEATLDRVSLTMDQPQANTQPMSLLLRHPFTYSLTFSTQSENAQEVTIRADSLAQNGSSLQILFRPGLAAEGLQPFLFYRSSFSLAVQSGMGPSSDRIFSPDISEMVSVAVTTTSATISWPPFTSSSITLSGLGYSYQSTQPEELNDKDQSVLLGTASSLSLMNLEEGATYSFLIVPSGSSLVPLANSRLFLEFVTTFTTTSDAPSGPPLNFTTVDSTITSSSVELSWGLPAVVDRNGDITNFTLSFNASTQSQTKATVVATPSSPSLYTHTLQGLSANTFYVVTIAAVNANGTGPETSTQVKTLSPASPQNNALSTTVPIIVAGAVILAALIVIIVVMAVAAVCLWHKKYRGSYDPKSKPSFWIKKPQPLGTEATNGITDPEEKDDSGDESPRLEVNLTSDQDGEAGNTSTPAMLMSSGTFIAATSTTTAATTNSNSNGTETATNAASNSTGLKSKEGSYDSLSPKEIAAIVSKTNANNNSSESLVATGEYDQSWTPYAKPLIHSPCDEEENHYEGVLIAPHTYEDPQSVQYQKKARTLPLASADGEYSVPFGSQYTNIPGTNIADNTNVDTTNHYANTLDASELHKLRSDGISQGDSLPYRSNSGLLDNGYATPRKFPIYDSIMGDSSVRYDVMSPDQSESGNANGMLTSSTPVPPNGLY